ncbi:hypothetical protein FQZ97_914150 [compost metagenome]
MALKCWRVMSAVPVTRSPLLACSPSTAACARARRACATFRLGCACSACAIRPERVSSPQACHQSAATEAWEAAGARPRSAAASGRATG